MGDKKINLKLENSVVVESFSDAQLRRCPKVQKIINKTLNDVCTFYTYFEVLKKSKKLSQMVKISLYDTMLAIKEIYGYPVLANKLDEAENYLRR